MLNPRNVKHLPAVSLLLILHSFFSCIISVIFNSNNDIRRSGRHSRAWRWVPVLCESGCQSAGVKFLRLILISLYTWHFVIAAPLKMLIEGVYDMALLMCIVRETPARCAARSFCQTLRLCVCLQLACPVVEMFWTLSYGPGQRKDSKCTIFPLCPKQWDTHSVELLLPRVGSRLCLGLYTFLRTTAVWHHTWNCCSNTINSATNSFDFGEVQQKRSLLVSLETVSCRVQIFSLYSISVVHVFTYFFSYC